MRCFVFLRPNGRGIFTLNRKAKPENGFQSWNKLGLHLPMVAHTIPQEELPLIHHMVCLVLLDMVQ